jgi:peptidyl-prolyl cis-trans isomerase C
VPLAALVNGTEIALSEYQAELRLYQSALGGSELTTEDNKRVLDDMIDQALLAQAAKEENFVVDPEMLQQHQEQLVARLGSEQALIDWMATYGYDEDSFRRVLMRSIAAAWMRDQIVAALPLTAEQVHARQILLYNSGEANQVLAQLQAGNDFGNLALEYDPLAGGDLGWFPRGYLPDQQLEEVAFSLQVDEYSAVIQTLAGYHIVQVLERDAERLLEPDALLVLQIQAVQDWLEARRSASDIQIFVS